MKRIINNLAVFTEGTIGKTPIIFVHGFPYDHTMWDFQVNALKDNYYCITYDVRGLGESYVGDGQYTMEAYVQDLFSIITELNLDKPVLCGHSMGGYISFRAAEINQFKFSGFIFVDTKPSADDNAAKLKRAAAINQINTEGLAPFVEAFVKNTFSDISLNEKKELIEDTLKKSYKHNPIGVKGALIAMLSRTDTTNFLQKIKLPTLLIYGSFDTLTPPTLMREIAEKIPNSEFAVIPRAGHMSPLENPDNVNDLIKGFLERRII
ncbi:alpha/beta fold hydrolase [Melioribacteraceae bacterium 4301-Me]|uniref:alpha/beta fold hydrolase n=1 Tax=Pyranulibacter aquaticus TaxID=3163344 RepID=UPI003594E861